MTACLGHSLTGLLPGDATEAEQLALLVSVARACPATVFHDVLWTPEGPIPVRVADGRVARIGADIAPERVGGAIADVGREHLDLLMDHGDVLLPGWTADPDHELVIADQPRVVADLTEMADLVAEAETEDDIEDDDYLTFLALLSEAIAVARAEGLPVVVRW